MKKIMMRKKKKPLATTAFVSVVLYFTCMKIKHDATSLNDGNCKRNNQIPFVQVDIGDRISENRQRHQREEYEDVILYGYDVLSRHSYFRGSMR